jgi:prophage antirepressor-like protein
MPDVTIVESNKVPNFFNFTDEAGNIMIVDVRAEGEETLFRASDVAKCLGYKDPTDMLGRRQQVPFLTESQLYEGLMLSRAANAAKFRKWVCGIVLPSIRKTGGYSIAPNPALPNFLDPAEAAIAWATEYKAKQLALADNERLTAELIETTTNFREFKSVTRLSAPELSEVEQMLGDIYTQALVMYQAVPASQRFEVPSRSAGRHKGRAQAAIKTLCGLDDKKHTYKDAPSLKMPAIIELLNAELTRIKTCLKCR